MTGSLAPRNRLKYFSFKTAEKTAEQAAEIINDLKTTEKNVRTLRVSIEKHYASATMRSVENEDEGTQEHTT